MKVDFCDIIPLESEKYEKTVRKIEKISKKVFDVGMQLMMSPDQSVYNEFDMHLKYFNERKIESVQLLRLFYYFDKPRDAAERGKDILNLIKHSKKLIKEKSADFQVYQENWNKYNQRLKEQIAFTTFLTKKGAKVRKVLFGSIFIFLKFDSPTSRFNFIEEFNGGDIEKKALRFLVTEDFLGYFQLQSARVEITIEDDDTIFDRLSTGKKVAQHVRLILAFIREKESDLIKSLKKNPLY